MTARYDAIVDWYEDTVRPAGAADPAGMVEAA
jgi:hypothetical protein